MINCERCEELMSARLDGELSQQDARLLEDHLAQCPDCQRLDRDLTSLHHRLKTLAVDPPEGFAAAVLSQLEVPTMQPKKKKTPWAAIACAAAAVVLTVAVLSPQMGPFGGPPEDAAAAEGAEAPQAADLTGDAAPAEGEGEAAEQETLTDDGSDNKRQDPQMTQTQAQKILEDYLAQEGRTLAISPSSLSEDGSAWSFTARDRDTGERFLFTVFCSDGFVEEVPLP